MNLKHHKQAAIRTLIDIWGVIGDQVIFALCLLAFIGVVALCVWKPIIFFVLLALVLLGAIGSIYYINLKDVQADR